MTRSQQRAFAITVAALVVIGIGFRIWMLRAPIGALDSDAAVPGLMALRLRHLELPVFYWGQAYAGSLESLVAGLLFLVIPTSATALKVLATLATAGAVAVTWRIGIRLVGRTAATLGAAIMWAFPPGLVWWSTKFGVYWGALLVTLIAFLLLLRLTETEDWPLGRRVAFGFAAGVAWWLNPQCLFLLLPAAIAFAPRLWERWRQLAPVIVAGVVGAAPWLAYNVVNHWASLHTAKQPGDVPNSYVDHLRVFGKVALPMTLGLRRLYDHRWAMPPAGQALYAIAVVAGIAFLIAGRKRYGTLRILLIGFPIAYALSPYAWFAATPRYMTFLLPTTSLALGLAFARRWLWVPGVALVVALSVSGLTFLNGNHGAVTAVYTFNVPVPANFGPLKALVREHDIKYGYAHHWLAYRLTFETREHVIITPAVESRFRDYDRRVRAHADEAWYLFVDHADWLTRFLAQMQARNIPVEMDSAGGFTVVHPLQPVRPEDVPSVWGG